jgi:hypothetical protein
VPLARLLPPTAGGVVEDVAGAGGWVGVGWAGCVGPDAYLQSCIHDVSWRGQTKTEAWLRPACAVCHARQHLLLGVQGALRGNGRQGGGCEGWMVASWRRGGAAVGWVWEEGALHPVYCMCVTCKVSVHWYIV